VPRCLITLILLFAAYAVLAEAQASAPPAPATRLAEDEARNACNHVPFQMMAAAAERPELAWARLNDEGVYQAFMEFRRAVNYTPTLDLHLHKITARWSRPEFEIMIKPPRPGGIAQAAIPGFYTVLMIPRRVMALPLTLPLEQAGGVRAQVMPPTGTARGELTALKLTFEPPATYLEREWRIFVLPCFAGTGGRFVAGEFAELDVRLVGRWAAAGVGLLVVALILLVLGAAAYRINGWQMDAEAAERSGLKPIQLFISPIFICQDGFGQASLARFQVFLFTLVLLGVYAYAFAASQEPPEVSNSVLALTGITLAGSTLAAAASRPSLDGANRLWLNGTGVLRSVRRIPRWSDLVTGDGEIDITRVQALGFSLFAATALVVNGAQNLGSFEIPEQLNYLIGLSQAVYVAGKALPVDSLRRLNDDLSALRAAEQRALGKDEAAAEWQEFMRMKTGAAVALFDVFGERMDRTRLLAIRPGDRWIEPIPPQPAGGFAPA